MSNNKIFVIIVSQWLQKLFAHTFIVQVLSVTTVIFLLEQYVVLLKVLLLKINIS